MLVLFGFLLKATPSTSRPPENIEARIMELPADGLAGGGVSAGTMMVRPKDNATKTPFAGKFVTKTLHVVRPHQVRPAVHKAVVAAIEKTPSPALVNTDETKLAPKSESNSSSALVRANSASIRDQAGSGSGTRAGSGNGAGTGSGDGTGGSVGSSGSGPVVVYAPVPTIPDDMRDEVVQAVAVARFRVFHDGKVLVSLTEPTEFSRLNEVILATLRQWRFHPALRNGAAIDSDAEVHLRITVQ